MITLATSTPRRGGGLTLPAEPDGWEWVVLPVPAGYGRYARELAECDSLSRTRVFEVIGEALRRLAEATR